MLLVQWSEIIINYVQKKQKKKKSSWIFGLKWKQIGRRCRDARYWFVPFIRDGYVCRSSAVTCLPNLPVQRTCTSSGKRALAVPWQCKYLHSSDRAVSPHVCCFDLHMSGLPLGRRSPHDRNVERVNTVRVDYRGKLLTLCTRLCAMWSPLRGVWVTIKTQHDGTQIKQWETLTAFHLTGEVKPQRHVDSANTDWFLQSFQRFKCVDMFTYKCPA